MENLKRKLTENTSEGKKRFKTTLQSLEEPNVDLIANPSKRSAAKSLQTGNSSDVLNSIVAGKCTLSPVINIKKHKKHLRKRNSSNSKNHTQSPPKLFEAFEKITQIPQKELKVVQKETQVFKKLNSVLEEEFSQELTQKILREVGKHLLKRVQTCSTPLNPIKVPSSCKRLKRLKRVSKVKEEIKRLKNN